MSVNASKKIVFMDCETTSLRPDRRAWEIATVVVPDLADPSQDIETVIHVAYCDLDLGNADLFALNVGRFYERHMDFVEEYPAGVLRLSEQNACTLVVDTTAGAVIHGSHPSFDMATLEPRMRAHGMLPRWHYHPRDVPDFARGAMVDARSFDLYPSSEDVSRAWNVDPTAFERHTALGDCRWQLTLYRKVLGLPVTAW